MARRKRRKRNEVHPCDVMPPGLESRKRPGVFLPWKEVHARAAEKMARFDASPPEVQERVRNAKE